MKKRSESFQKKQDNNEHKNRTRLEKSGESPESPEKQRVDTFSIAETPFLPRMKEHADILTGTQFTAQRNNFIQQLHQTYGSRYVQRLLASMNVQAELTVSHPNDIYEQEADRIADIVTKTLNSPVQRQAPEEEELLQGKSSLARALPEEEELLRSKITRQVPGEEEEELIQGKLDIARTIPEEEEELLQGKLDITRQAPEEEELQMQPDSSRTAMVSKDIETRINSARGGGQPLADNIKGPMEQAFRADFGGVNVHTDTESDTLNQQLSAKAFTTGQDIFFREGEYSPGSDSGNRLIAHELTHVVQQSGGQINRDSKSEAVALQPDNLTVQREWVPTADNLKFLNTLNPSAFDVYKLEDYFRYSGLYNMLEGFARSIDVAENIHFLKDMEEYGPKPEAAENIWHKYLMDDATEPINISGPTMTALRTAYGTIRQQAQTAFERAIGHSGPAWEIRCPVCNELKMGYGHVPGRAVFTDAKKEILNLVDTNNILTRFKEKAKAFARG
jgi:hypothetical protein